MELKVSRLAKLAGVSVRTLHHYDELGLLRPSGRSEAGYRLYAYADLQRLQQILFFKELGFPLEEVARILDDPDFDLRAALQMQRGFLEERQVRLSALIDTVNRTLGSIERGTTMSEKELLGVFGDFDPAEHEAEAKARWGETEAYRESSRRTAGYGKPEWEAIKTESAEIYAELGKAMAEGRAPDAPEVAALAERHRAHIERWFYPCPKAMHAGLGEMYVNDPRFTKNIDKFGKGLAAYLKAAFRANAEGEG